MFVAGFALCCAVPATPFTACLGAALLTGAARGAAGFLGVAPLTEGRCTCVAILPVFCYSSCVLTTCQLSNKVSRICRVPIVVAATFLPPAQSNRKGHARLRRCLPRRKTRRISRSGVRPSICILMTYQQSAPGWTCVSAAGIREIPGNTAAPRRSTKCGANHLLPECVHYGRGRSV